MNIKTIQMEKMQAWNCYQEYIKATGHKVDVRDKAIAAGYRQLAKGKIVINLLDVMKTAGCFEGGMPRFAICRADSKICEARRYENGSAIFKSLERYSSPISLPQATFPSISVTKFGRAIVPLIPPKFRPTEKTIMNYWILWEAEWERVPVDPILLKKLHGWLYVVVAQWDLTPLEQAVLR